MTWNVSDYLRTVTDIAEEALAEYPGTDGIFQLDDDERREYVSQSVDGSEFIIYYSANEIVLQASQNEPDGAEVRAISAEWWGTIGADWRTQRTLAAYVAMEADVLAEIDRLFWAPFADGARDRYAASLRA